MILKLVFALLYQELVTKFINFESVCLCVPR